MIEFRIKVPDDLSKGLWPAAWLLGTNQAADGWPYCGEIDMMEMGHNSSFRNEQEFPNANENNLVAGNLIFYDEDACADNNQTCAASISFDKYYNQPYHTSETLTDRFMIYRMYWDEEQIRLTVDDNGNVQNLYTGPFPISGKSSAFTKPFYLLLNLAVGGNFTDASNSSEVTAELPGKMYIDYVRIKQWNGRGEVFGADQVMANAGANKTISENEPLTLDASGSYGPITSYEWSLDGNVVATTKTHEISLNAGTHIFTLTVSDEQGNSSTDTLKVTVGDNEIGNVIWEDNFESLNPDYWNIDIGDGCEEDLCGWGNQELQSYQEDNVYIEEIDSEPGNYALVLEAKKEAVGNSAFTSGKVTTENKVAIKYGVVEVRMKAPDVSNGLWPAAWLLGINHREVGWPYCGEIDMMEMGHAASERQAEGFSGSANNFVRANLLWYASGACDIENPTCAASIAFDKYYTTPYTPSSALNNRFVTYRMYWNESQIRLTVVDGNNEHDLYTNPFPIGPNEEAFTKPYYFLLNLAVGGSFTGFNDADDITAPLPGKLYIDYVRVKEWNGQGEVSFSGGSVLANAGKDIVKEDLNQDGVETVTL
ncbi:MAG: family 16 glycosylhydrolase, partial [Paracoccaceae bacterium]